MPLRFANPTPEAYGFPLTVRHLLDSALTTAADQEIIYRDQCRFTYRQFVERIARLASFLSTLGAEEGMTIAVMDWDSHRYLEAYFAIPMMGAVLQTVNVRVSPEQLVYSLVNANARILLVHEDFFPLLEEIRASLPDLKAVVAIMDGAEGAVPDYMAGEYEELSASASPGFEFRDFDENAIATTYYTSGTTGNPKGVCFSHRQLVLHTLALCGPWGNAHQSGISADHVYMPLTPMFHAHAWGMPYIATMLGMMQVYPGRYDAEMICQLRRRHRVSYSHCVPTVLQMVIEAAGRTGTDLAGWAMTIGGSALTEALYEEGWKHGVRLNAGYGMSETAPAIALSRMLPGAELGHDAQVEQLTKAGVPIPLVSIRIVDENMNTLPNDGVTRGELVVRAPWLTPHYTGDAEGSEALWRGGWLHTQDIATIDSHGNVTIRDRLKDVIKSGGEWIDSIQIERLVASVEEVADVAVIGVQDAKWGERPLAVIVPRVGCTISLEAVNGPVERAIADGAITRYARLDHFALVEDLPKTSVGKIDKKELRARYGAGFPEGAS